MKRTIVSTRTRILASIVTILLFSASRGAEATEMMLPIGRSPGPVVVSDGTPFEEPELHPHLPQPPKGPGGIPFESSYALRGDSRVGQGEDPQSRWSRFHRVLIQWVHRMQFPGRGART